MLDYLKSGAAGSGGVTQGERGCSGRRSGGGSYHACAADLARARARYNGAGDVFHGAYVFSYLNNPGKSCTTISNLRARPRPTNPALGNEAGLPTLTTFDAVKQEFQIGRKERILG